MKRQRLPVKCWAKIIFILGDTFVASVQLFTVDQLVKFGHIIESFFCHFFLFVRSTFDVPHVMLMIECVHLLCAAATDDSCVNYERSKIESASNSMNIDKWEKGKSKK